MDVSNYITPHITVFTIYTVTLTRQIKIYVDYLTLKDHRFSGALSNGGLLKYFTYWTLFIHWITFGVILASDYTGSPFVTELGDKLFYSLAFPMGTLVSMLFWCVLYTLDHDSLDTEEARLFEPFLVNHVSHTLPFVAVLLENIGVDHNIEHHSNGLSILMPVLLAYSSVLFFVGHIRGEWIYPFMAKMGTITRYVFIAGCIGICVLLFQLGAVLHNFAWL